jgi:hypothetical protein
MTIISFFNSDNYISLEYNLVTDAIEKGCFSSKVCFYIVLVMDSQSFIVCFLSLANTSTVDHPERDCHFDRPSSYFWPINTGPTLREL